MRPLLELLERTLAPLAGVSMRSEAGMLETLTRVERAEIDADLVRTVRRALEQIGVPDPAPYAHALRSRNAFVRLAVVEVVESVRGEHLPRLLAIALEDRDPPVRFAAVAGLDGVQDARGMKLLVRALDDRDERVREEARRVFGNARPRDAAAVQPVADALRHGSAQVRGAAAEWLGKCGQPAAVEPLVRALGDRDETVRLVAAKALGDTRDPAAVDGLAAALRDRAPAVRERAALSLRSIKDPRAVDPLARALRDPARNVREAAMEALIKTGPPSTPALIPVLRDPDPEARYAAAFALDVIADPRSLPALLAAMGEQDPRVKGRIVEALGKIHDPRAADALMEATEDERVVGQAISALGRQKDPRAVDLLLRLLEARHLPGTARALGEIGDRRAVAQITFELGQPRPQNAGELLEALGRLGGPGVLETLLRWLESADVPTREAAARALKALEDRRAVPALDAALRRGGIEGAAVEALAEFKDPSSVPDLVGAMENPRVQYFTRQRAAEALAAIGPPAVPALVGVALGKEKQSAGFAIAALAEIRDPRAVEPLATVARGESHSRAAIAALEKQGSPAVPALIGLLGEKSWDVQREAIRALGRLGDPRAVEPLLAVLQEPDGLRRAEVESALGMIGDRRALPALRALEREEKGSVQVGARSAIEQIERAGR